MAHAPGQINVCYATTRHYPLEYLRIWISVASYLSSFLQLFVGQSILVHCFDDREIARLFISCYKLT